MRATVACSPSIHGETTSFLEKKAVEHESAGMTVVFFGWEGKARGFFVFGDRLRQGAKDLVERLHRRGLKVMLLSGDGTKTTEAVARSLGITGSLGEAVPAEKSEFIADLQREGRKVGMVGDGINDAAALARADVSFAIGAGSRHHERSFGRDNPGRKPRRD